MLCLGIETSCDETALALVRDGRLVAERMASQARVHSVFGGVVPELASRRHLSAIKSLCSDLLDGAGVDMSSIDRICAARGPGLLGSLLVGLGFAKGLALGLDVPLIGVNHLHAHLLAPGLERDLKFPCLGLLVSGGHTQIYYIRSPREFEVLGGTLDDAAGEAFDKVAKCLNLPYPGGVFIDRLASQAGPGEPDLFSCPYVDNDNLDFSFSGLKTAVANYVRSRPGLALESLKEDIPDNPDPELVRVCAAFNRCVARTLRIKLERALNRFDPSSVIVAGGVAANSRLRSELSDLAGSRGIELVLPDTGLCTDNGAMVAYAGYLLARAGLCHDLDLEAVPRGRQVPFDYLQCPAEQS